MIKLFKLILLALPLISCGSSSGTPASNTPGNTSGSITLSGSDTSVVGKKLNTGFVGSSLAAGSQPDYIIIVDNASRVTFTPPNTLTPVISDPQNGFILVVTDDGAGSGIKGISMSIIKAGAKFDYACSSPISAFIDCGTNAINLNIANKTITFNNAAVFNVVTGSTLTMDGTLTWNGSIGTGTTEPKKEIPNSLILSGDDVGSELVRNLVLDIAETYSDPGDVNGFLIDNSKSSNGTNTFVDMTLNVDAITGYYSAQLHVANSSNGNDWHYECNDDPQNAYQLPGCNNKITINETNRTFTFNNATLYPITGALSDTDQSTAPLTINGVMVWSL